MTVSATLREAAQRLAEVSDTARLDAELLMAEALGVSRSELLLRHGATEVPEAFTPMLERRMKHEPVAYILGRQEFYGRDFLVSSEVLIPRGDSETIIEAALGAAPQARRVLDCGVGSGALLLTILAELPEAKGIGIDRSLGALAVAAANAKRLGLDDRANMLHADWHDSNWADGLGLFDLVIANPPYVEIDADLTPSVRQFEPAGALFAGAEGLDDYRVLIPQLPLLLLDGGSAVLEIGHTQQESVATLARASGFAVKPYFDLAGRSRALLLQ